MVKLMMTLASEQEIDDAEIAEGIVRLIDAHPQLRRRVLNNAALGTQYAALVSRYGVLFRGRRLQCRNCLGVRYGEVKPKRRLKKDLIIIKNPRTTGGRRRKPQLVMKLTKDERAALRKLNDVMNSIRRSNDAVASFSRHERLVR